MKVGDVLDSLALSRAPYVVSDGQLVRREGVPVNPSVLTGHAWPSRSRLAKARSLVLDRLATVEEATREDVTAHLKRLGVGSRYAWEALQALVLSGEIGVSRKRRGGACIYRLLKFRTLAIPLVPDFCETSGEALK